jgi:hypothetical protein
MSLDVDVFLLKGAVAFAAAVQITKFVITELTGLWIYLRLLRTKTT